MLTGFLPRYNRRFAVPARQPGTGDRQVSDEHLDVMFSFKYWRTVGMDNTVRFYQHRIQIQSDRHRVSYARCRVEVHPADERQFSDLLSRPMSGNNGSSSRSTYVTCPRKHSCFTADIRTPHSSHF